MEDGKIVEEIASEIMRCGKRALQAMHVVTLLHWICLHVSCLSFV
jgi:tRNA pseudouridine-54 N-methylase